MYSPTTSTSFSSKRLSLESLNVSTRWGLRPLAVPHPLHGGGRDPGGLGHRPTAPVRLALGLGLLGEPDDLVDLFLRDAGFAPPAFAHLAELGQALGGKSGPAIPAPSAPTPRRSGSAELAAPSAANNSARALSTSRWAAVVDLAMASRVALWPSVSSNGAAAWFMSHCTTTINLFARRYTSMTNKPLTLCQQPIHAQVNKLVATAPLVQRPTAMGEDENPRVAGGRRGLTGCAKNAAWLRLQWWCQRRD